MLILILSCVALLVGVIAFGYSLWARKESNKLQEQINENRKKYFQLKRRL